MVTRNEALRLPSALRHLRHLGVDRVLLVDNRSTDETREIAAADERVHLVDAPGSYAGSNFGVDWTNALLDRYARGHWVLVVDADEKLVFPGSDRPEAAAPCARCAGTWTRSGRKPCPRSCSIASRPSPCATCASGAATTSSPPRPGSNRRGCARRGASTSPYRQQFGGLRERLFFPEADPRRPARLVAQKIYNLLWRVPALRASERFRALAPKRSPNLTKVPLIRWREGAGLVSSTHMLRPMALAGGTAERRPAALQVPAGLPRPRGGRDRQGRALRRLARVPPLPRSPRPEPGLQPPFRAQRPLRRAGAARPARADAGHAGLGGGARRRLTAVRAATAHARRG